MTSLGGKLTAPVPPDQICKQIWETNLSLSTKIARSVIDKEKRLLTRHLEPYFLTVRLKPWLAVGEWGSDLAAISASRTPRQELDKIWKVKMLWHFNFVTDALKKRVLVSMKYLSAVYYLLVAVVRYSYPLTE
jgi:hypothetical protein